MVTSLETNLAQVQENAMSTPILSRILSLKFDQIKSSLEEAEYQEALSALVNIDEALSEVEITISTLQKVRDLRPASGMQGGH
eukprot:8946389-Pyramimonas_sp.AAC.1